MKKRFRYVRWISAVGMTVLCLVGIFGLLKSADMMSVSAEQDDLASGTDVPQEEISVVSPADEAVRETRQKTVTRSEAVSPRANLTPPREYPRDFHTQCHGERCDL